MTGLAQSQSAPLKAESPKPAPKVDEASAAISAAGVFGGLQLYNTYLNIGFISDLMTAGVYDPAQGFVLLGTVIQPLDLVENQLDRLANLNLPKEDLAAVARLKKITVLLRAQGKELQIYWEKGKKENGGKYDAARKAAWKELNALLELEPKSETLPTPRTPAPQKP
jgi:hypothetical protein